MLRKAACLIVLALVFTVPASAAVLASARMPALYRSCKAFNAKYPHGVGRAAARDRTSGDDPVTNFRRSTRLYKLAMSYNRGLDRDKDGVACEKH